MHELYYTNQAEIGQLKRLGGYRGWNGIVGQNGTGHLFRKKSASGKRKDFQL